MSYSDETVRAMIAQAMSVRDLANSVGQGEATAAAQHRVAAEFWTQAIALGILAPGDAAWATAEVARQRAAAERIANPPVGRVRREVV